MTKDEASLLLYLESRSVDDGGSVDVRRMNSDDFEIVTRWIEEGFIQFGRIAFHSIKSSGITHWVKLSERAWIIAHTERRARADRGFAKYYERIEP